MWKLALLVLMLATPVWAQPQDWFVCDCEVGAEGGCTPGSDAADGLTPATAFASYDRIQDEAVAAGHECGDTFNFCKGGVFNVAGPTEWLEAGVNCTGDQPPTVIQSYQAAWGGTGDPIVSPTGDSGVLAFNAANGHGVTVTDIRAICPPGTGTDGTCGGSSIGINLTAGVKGITLDGIEVSGFQTNVNLGPNAHLTLDNSLVRDGDDFGVVGQAGTSSITDTTFRDNGCRTALSDCTQQRALYLNCITPGCDTERILTIHRNLFDDNTSDPDLLVTEACGGNVVSLRGGTISFDDNTFTYTNQETAELCTSVRMGSITSGTCDDGNCQTCVDCTFRGNKIVGGHVGLNVSSWIDGTDSDNFGGIIENNVIVLPVKAGTNYLSNGPQAAIRVEEGATGVDSINLLIRNNTLLVGTPKTANNSTGLDLQPNTGTFTLANNAIRMLGTGTDSCFRWSSVAGFTDNTVTDNNICHRANVAASYAFLNNMRTLASVQGEGGTNPANEDHSQDGDPGFVGTAPSYDITLQRGDLAIDAGATLAAPDDFFGATRPGGAAPDVGAFEWYPGWYACDCESGAEGGCVPGSDTNPGTREAPYESYDKLQDQVANMACGDTFNFCRGGKWTAAAGSADWSKAALSCASDPILIQSYHPHNTNFVAKPKIQLATHATTFNFDDAGNNIWLQNLDLTCSGACTAGANGTVLAATGDAIKLDAMVFDGWTTGLEVSAGTIPNAINNIFRNNDVRAILANPGTGSVFNNNTFTNNSCLTGGTCSAEQAMLLTCTTVGECTRTVTVTNNTFTDNTMDPTAAPAGACNGNTLSLRGGTFVVEGNQFSITDPTLTTGACENVRIGSITAGEPEQECIDCLFRRNRIVGGNVGLAIQSWADGGDGDAWGGIIENNIIILPENTSSTTFAANISGRESDNGGIDNANTLIRNNSMIIGDNASVPAGADSAAFDLRDNTGTYVVRNNTIRIDGLGENVCFKYASNANLADRIDTDFNLCDRLADPGTNGWGALGGAPVDLATFHAVDADTDDDQSWDTQSGFVGLSPDWDMHLVSDVVQLIGFPFFGQFVTLEIDGGGDPNNFAPVDITGVARPIGNPLGLGFVPDIGAYEALVPPIPVGR